VWPKDLSEPNELATALKSDAVTRAGVLSRVAELYDPCGWWEPVKLQMKLAMQGLVHLDWTEAIPVEERTVWMKLFPLMSQLKEISLPHYAFEKGANPQNVRIIALADAAESACGCAVYAGMEVEGSFSCTLLLARSKLVHNSVPRNELEGVVLASEAALVVRRALGSSVKDLRVYTDSRIAVCWVLNSSRKLRMWAYNRAQAARNLIKIISEGEEFVPLFHIEGVNNLADMITKERSVKISDVDRGSLWQNGLPWMTLPTHELPNNQFETPPKEMTDEFNREIFQEVEVRHMAEATMERDLLIRMSMTLPIIEIQAMAVRVEMTPTTWFMMEFDLVRMGWQRGWRKLNLVVRAVKIFRHGPHKASGTAVPACSLCSKADPFAIRATNRVIDRTASWEAQREMPRAKLARKFTLVDGVWLSRARLFKEGAVECQDLDTVPFFDHLQLKKFVPVVPVSSEIFHSYLAYIHLVELPHMGVENTLRRRAGAILPLGVRESSNTEVQSQVHEVSIVAEGDR